MAPILFIGRVRVRAGDLHHRQLKILNSLFWDSWRNSCVSRGTARMGFNTTYSFPNWFWGTHFPNG